MIRGRGSRILQRQKNCWDGNLKSNCERACLSWKRISDNGLAFLKSDVQSNFPYPISEESECCRVDNFFAIEAFLSHKSNGCVGTGIQINECFIQLVFLLFLRSYDCCYDTVFGGMNTWMFIQYQCGFAFTLLMGRTHLSYATVS